jgi:hypothetical protein
MGYRIKELAKLPVIPGIDLYIFLLGEEGWRRSAYQYVQENFLRLAERLGPKAAIVSGHDGLRLKRDLLIQLSGDKSEHSGPPGLEELANDAEGRGGSLLILETHPQNMTKDTLALYLPLAEVGDRFGDIDRFLDELCAFAHTRDEAFIRKFQEAKPTRESVLNALELKPNFWGIGINLTKFIELIRKNKKG